MAAFLKAIGYLIPLMDAEYANYYTREVMLILIREFQSPDEEMKKIVLKVSFPTLLHPSWVCFILQAVLRHLKNTYVTPVLCFDLLPSF